MVVKRDQFGGYKSDSGFHRPHCIPFAPIALDGASSGDLSRKTIAELLFRALGPPGGDSSNWQAAPTAQKDGHCFSFINESDGLSIISDPQFCIDDIEELEPRGFLAWRFIAGITRARPFAIEGDATVVTTEIAASIIDVEGERYVLWISSGWDGHLDLKQIRSYLSEIRQGAKEAKKPNQRAEPTRGTAAENWEARSQNCARRRVAHA